MVERTGWAAPRGVCQQCKGEGNYIQVFGGDGWNTLKGEFCSFECELRSRGVSIQDGWIDILLEERLRGRRDGDVGKSEAVERI